MTIKYVDYEGESGTGDGSSFANRAGMVRDLTLSAGDEVRIKKTPDPTSLGTGQVRRAQGHPQYNPKSISGNNVVYSTTDGETKLQNMGNGWSTGDIIHIYHADSTVGKSLSGLWRVTVESGTSGNATLKLDNFPGAPNTTATAFGVKFVAAVNAIYLNTNNLTKSIACRDSYRDSWTVTGSGVTASYSHPSYSDWSQSYDHIVFTGSDTFSLSSGTSNGKLAHYELPNSLDLSDYQQVSFNFRHNQLNNTNSNKLSLRLCTDTAGNTSVHTIPIDYKSQTRECWTGLTVDLGTNLNSSIQSIALYQDSAIVSSINMQLQNIVACKASTADNGITLDKLIGLNTTDDPAWYPIQFIWDNIIFLKTQNLKRSSFGYYGSNAAAFSDNNFSATIYQRKQYRADNSYVDIVGGFTDAWDTAWTGGTDGNPITVTGGWDATSMSTRNGKTCVELNGQHIPFDVTVDYLHLGHVYYTNFGNIIENYQTGIKLSHVGYSYFDDGLRFNDGSTEGIGIDFIISGSLNGAVRIDGGSNTGNISDYYINQAVGGNYTGKIIAMFSFGASVSFNLINCVACGCAPFYLVAGNHLNIGTLKWGYNSIRSTTATPGFTGEAFVTIDRYDAIAPVTKTIYIDGPGSFTVNDYNYTADTTYGSSYYRYGQYLNFDGPVDIDEGGVVTIIDAGTFPNGSRIHDGGKMQIKNATNNFSWSLEDGGYVEIIGYQGTSGDNRAFFEGGTEIVPETSTRHTASGFAWKCTGTTPTTISLGQIVVSANTAVTVGIWTYKTSPQSFVTLKIPRDLVRGVSAQEVDNSSASQNTWTKIEKTFTPTASGPLKIQVQLSSNATVFIDDLEVS